MPFYAHTSRDSGTDGWQELREHLEAVAAITSRLADSSKIRLSVRMNSSSTAVGVAGQMLGCQATKNELGVISAPVIGDAVALGCGVRFNLYFIAI